MTTATTPAPSKAVQTVLAYHQRTKHHLNRYAAGPETLDWDAQPNPFRSFDGAPRIELPLHVHDDALLFSDLPAAQAQPFSLETLAYLLELSMGLAAWKEFGPDRWALRCNPSSGNLHPTECYVLAFGIAGLDDGLYHYLSREHVLELRWQPTEAAQPKPPGLFIGLSSIHWREAWKYGERAFRYCQLDIGHAVGALRYAAATVGWATQLNPSLDSDQLATLLGLDRDADFDTSEREDPELLLDVIVPGIAPGGMCPEIPDAGNWTGRANLLDPHPINRWPIIDQVAEASRQPAYPPEPPTEIAHWPARTAQSSRTATDVIRGRRSAQHFNPLITQPAQTFFQIVDSLLPRAKNLPWDSLPFTPRLHLLLFVHRVDGLESGLYVLPRSAEGETCLRDQLHASFMWEPVALNGDRNTGENPAHLPLYLLLAGDVRKIARGFSCHQAIASDSCFSLALVAEFAPLLTEEPWRYRPLYWEAGLIGQVLYLEAEAAGFNGTGIGCFFDDAVHEGFGLKDDSLQVLYHFTVGQALVDSRISTLPPYAHRQAAKTNTPTESTGAPT